jgi:hypothetical protein
MKNTYQEFAKEELLKGGELIAKNEKNFMFIPNGENSTPVDMVQLK